MKMQGRITRIKETQVKEVHIMKIQVSSYKRNPEEVWGKYKSVNINCALKKYTRATGARLSTTAISACSCQLKNKCLECIFFCLWKEACAY